MESLQDKRIVVTGGASGIGLAAAQLLRERGANLFVVDLRQERVDETVAGLNALPGPAASGLACDIRNADSCEAMAEAAENHLGAIDVLVHCAGILRPPGGRPRPLFDLDLAEYESVVGTNLTGTFLVNRAVLRRMIPRKAGHILNISSTSGKRGRPLDALYSASKAGVIGLTESIAEEVRPFGIRVDAMLPDAVDTPLWKQNGPLPLAPPGSISARRIATLILLSISLPSDTVCENMVIMPFKTRQRTAK